MIETIRGGANAAAPSWADSCSVDLRFHKTAAIEWLEQRSRERERRHQMLDTLAAVVRSDLLAFFQELAAQAERFVGGELLDYGDAFDRQCGASHELPRRTRILAVECDPDDKEWDGGRFEVRGEHFSCATALSVGYPVANPDFPRPVGGVALRGYEGTEFHLAPKPEAAA